MTEPNTERERSDRLSNIQINDCEHEVVREDPPEEGHEWEFVARVRIKLSHPELRDIVVSRSYKARPKFDDITHTPEKVHEHTDYWWADAIPSQGDGTFGDASADWKPNADLDDDKALWSECRYSATYDPAAELESIIHHYVEDTPRLESAILRDDD